MTRLLMLVEGQSEEIFVKRSLAPYLAESGVYAVPIVLWTKRVPSGGGFRGGACDWPQIRKSLMPLTKDADAWVTTILDFYGLPEDFPGRREIGQGDPRVQVAALQDRFAAEIGHSRFIPFFALHEFEAWLFCSPERIAEHFDRPGLAERLRKLAGEAGGPELINHGEKTHPKARLKGLDLGYKETSDGPILMEKIGISAIREVCSHFSAWLDRLQSLGLPPPE